MKSIIKEQRKSLWCRYYHWQIMKLKVV